MTRVLPDEILVAARELQSVRGQMGKLKRAEDQLRAAVLGALGDDTVGLTATGVKAVHVETQHRRKVNAVKLEAMYPEIFEAVMEEAEVKILKVDLGEIVLEVTP